MREPVRSRRSDQRKKPVDRPRGPLLRSRERTGKSRRGLTAGYPLLPEPRDEGADVGQRPRVGARPRPRGVGEAPFPRPRVGGEGDPNGGEVPPAEGGGGKEAVRP